MLALTLLLAFANPAADAPRCVAVLSTNDIHGNIDPQEQKVGTETLRSGGMLALSGYLAPLRRKYGQRLLLLDGGDIYQGTLTSNLSEGAALIAAMNHLGYDAAAVGNHEFDFGAGVAKKPQKPGQEAPVEHRLDVIKARLAEAKVPFLAINIYEKATHKPARWKNLLGSTLIDKGGIKVGLIGASTPDTPRVTRPQNVVTLDFLPPAPLIISAARDLRARGAELVVVAAHIGGKCHSTKDPDNITSCEMDGEVFQLLEQMPVGTVDVFVAGHTHQYLRHWVRGAALIEASARARALAWVDACVKPGGGIDKAASTLHEPVELCLTTYADGSCKPKKDGAGPLKTAQFLGADVVPSADLDKLLHPYAEKARAMAQRSLGVRLEKPLVRETSDGKTPLGNVVCDAMRHVTGAPMAIQNLGGVRADLPAGELTFQSVFEALPFDNRVAVMKLSGAEVHAFVMLLVERRAGATPLLSGLRLTGTGKDAKLELADGKPLDPAARYDVATNDFLALGGEDLFRVLKDVKPEHVNVMDLDLREALVAYLQSKKGVL